MTCSDEVCKQCPFRRKSLPGYLGDASYDPHGFLAPHYHGDVRLPCHMKVNWNNKAKTAKHVDTAPLCRGFVIFMKNNVKGCENEEVREAVKTVKEDRVNIFSWFTEFIDHHKERNLK